MQSIRDNRGFTEIARRLGYQQPAIGSFAVMLALDVAAGHIEASREAKDFRDYIERNDVPVSARRYKRAIAEVPKLAA